LTTFSAGQLALAGGAGIIGGAVNAIAGGGTLITFPALVAIGATKVQANTTNTVALCPGYFGGAVAQRGQLVDERPRLRRLSIAAGLGGLTGSVLLITTGEAVFSAVVPYLILLACALLAFQNPLKRVLRVGQREHALDTTHPMVATATTYAVSIYGGYFGAGLGIMLLAVLGVILDDPLPRINAMRQVLALAVNVVAAVFFSFTGEVLWVLVLVMAPCALLGGAIGGKLVGRIKAEVLRAVVVTYGTILAIVYLVR
jgi:uncharacterized membrane protein YfcA